MWIFLHNCFFKLLLWNFLLDQCFNYFIKSVRIQLEIAVYFSTSCFNLFMIFNFNTNRPFVLFLSCFIILTLSTKWIVSRNYELVLLHVCVYKFRLLTKYLQAKCYYMYNVLWSSWFTYYVCLKCAFDRNYIWRLHAVKM